MTHYTKLGFGLLTLAAGTLSGCGTLLKQDTPVTNISDPAQYCNFTRYRLDVDAQAEPSDDLSTFTNNVVEASLTDEGTLRPMLFMSGGNMRGAFGAGVLSGWAGDDNQLPEFGVVTGISTGAILSVAAFANVTEAAVDGYTITGEGEVLEKDKSPGGDLSLGDIVTAVFDGSVSNLGPMRNSLRNIIETYDLVPKIAERVNEDRLLLTGVVDLDMGEAVALDLGEQFVRMQEAGAGTQAYETALNCALSAIEASSSVPPGAPPVAIDNRLYADGGARFFVFSDRLGEVIQNDTDGVLLEAAGRQEQDVFVILNSNQEISRHCRKKGKDKTLGKKECAANEDRWDQTRARDAWTLPDVAFRMIDVLQVQVKEFSEAQIRQSFTSDEYNLKMIQIDLAETRGQGQNMAETDFFKGIAIPGEADGASKTCAEWRAYDAKTYQPFKFHHNEMRCLIEYGKAKAKRDNWKSD